MLMVVVYIVQPFDADVHAGLVGEIPESVHVIAIGFVAEILAINHPVCVLFMSLRMQLQLGIEEHISIGWGGNHCQGYRRVACQRRWFQSSK